MHTGVDWACAAGTPIMAAGNGVIEEAGRKGEYGNYVRIRHANGYKTAYGHMSRIAHGVSDGVKVRQGQIIGFVGTTGLSSGPHVHFEVLVNNSFVDPMSIQVPRERQLAGKQLADFQKERARIDDLMRRNPVSPRGSGRRAIALRLARTLTDRHRARRVAASDPISSAWRDTALRRGLHRLTVDDQVAVAHGQPARSGRP